MDEIQAMLDAREKYLLKLKKEKEKVLKKVPEGSLRINQKGKRIQYYHRLDPKDHSGKYIRKDNSELVKKLAQKDYDEKILCASEKELEAIYKFNHFFPEKSVEQIYANLHRERQKLIHPIVEPDEQFIKNWERVSYTGRRFSPDYPEYFTNKGERVRSKSEIFIADALEKEGIPYRYEYPFFIKGYGNIYPDFTALNVRTRKEVIWEHFGLMEDSEYVDEAITKINQYINKGYYLGDNLIFTFETKKTPLNLKIVKEMISHYLK